MRLTLLALYWTLATRNERSAMVRVVNSGNTRKLLVRIRRAYRLF
jgi:hypothetical protein